jgi:hypothetical protein
MEGGDPHFEIPTPGKGPAWPWGAGLPLPVHAWGPWVLPFPARSGLEYCKVACGEATVRKAFLDGLPLPVGMLMGGPWVLPFPAGHGPEFFDFPCGKVGEIGKYLVDFWQHPVALALLARWG